MTKKTAEKDQDIKQAPATTPAEPWNANWNVSRRLLEMRRKLRGTKLWKTFELQRSFEAFSIHALADEIEAVACDCGLISSFRVTKWEKVGNRTVLEGMVTFEDVDHGEIREYPGVGEAIDNGDKGLHKADSDARKVALINALNLGIGSDKEAENAKPASDAMAGSMGGMPQQSKQAADYIHQGTNGHAKPSETFTLEQRGMKAHAVLSTEFVPRVWSIVMNSSSVSALDEFIAMNRLEFDRFYAMDSIKGDELQAIMSTKRAGLTAAGRL